MGRDTLVRDLTVELVGEGRTVLTLDLLAPSDQPSLPARVQETVAQAPPGQALAVMVVNLESRADYSPELAHPSTPANTSLTTANPHRELFAKGVPRPARALDD